MSATAVNVTAGANAGTSPPAPVLTTLATDESGTFTCGTGTTPAAGAIAVINLSGSWSGYPEALKPKAFIQAVNVATLALGALCAAVSADAKTVTISCAVAPAASQANTVYAFSYQLFG